MEKGGQSASISPISRDTIGSQLTSSNLAKTTISLLKIFKLKNAFAILPLQAAQCLLSVSFET